MSGARLMVAAFGDAGHAFPAIALARELAAAGNEVVVESWERWRGAVEGLGIRFEAAEEYVVFPPPPPGSRQSAAAAAEALAPLLEEFGPDAVVSDVLTLAPSLAAEAAGVPRATLVPHLYPVHQEGMPFFAIGVMPPRTPLGRALWRRAEPLLELGLRKGREQLNGVRGRLGLEPQERYHGGISEELVLVATYPGLEYPREWPEEAVLCGPLDFELPHPDVELPEGAGPLVLVAPSTAHDPQCRLIRTSLEAFAAEDVRVVATTNGHRPREPIEVPENAVLVDWLSYSQLMPRSDLVVCHGGHGTVCRALGAGAPLLVSPALGDMAENGIRVQWSGAGLMLPRKLRRPATMRWAAQRILDDRSFADRARAVAVTAEGGTERAVRAVERLARRG